MRYVIITCLLVMLLAAVGCLSEMEQGRTADTMRWSSERARQWYAGYPWLVGCNFIPSSAINQLEMWQEDTFDPETIGRELGWASGLGFNVVRVYLHDLAYDQDPKSGAEALASRRIAQGRQGL